MATSVTLPALGESVTEGTVTRWLKQPGDQVAMDEPLLEVSTDKVDTEIPSPVAGTLLEIKVQEDETIEVGAELATIGDEGESAEGGSQGGEQAESGAGDEPPEPAQSEPEDDASAAQESAPAAQESSGDSGETKPASEAPQAGASGNAEGTSVTLPALGESVTEGTVTRWLKQVGDEVAVDEPLLEVSTDKVDTEIPSPVAGTLLDIKVAEDETVEVGAELAVIGSGDAASGGGAQPSQADDVPKSDAGEDEATGDGASEAGSQGVPSAVSGSDQSGSA